MNAVSIKQKQSLEFFLLFIALFKYLLNFINSCTMELQLKLHVDNLQHYEY